MNSDEIQALLNSVAREIDAMLSKFEADSGTFVTALSLIQGKDAGGQRVPRIAITAVDSAAVEFQEIVEPGEEPEDAAAAAMDWAERHL